MRALLSEEITPVLYCQDVRCAVEPSQANTECLAKPMSLSGSAGPVPDLGCFGSYSASHGGIRDCHQLRVSTHGHVSGV